MISLTGGAEKPARNQELKKQNTLEINNTSSDHLESSFDVNDRQMDTEYL
jgi:hypothetical protein